MVDDPEINIESEQFRSTQTIFVCYLCVLSGDRFSYIISVWIQIVNGDITAPRNNQKILIKKWVNRMKKKHNTQHNKQAQHTTKRFKKSIHKSWFTFLHGLKSTINVYQCFSLFTWLTFYNRMRVIFWCWRCSCIGWLTGWLAGCSAAAAAAVYWYVRVRHDGVVCVSICKHTKKR